VTPGRRISFDVIGYPASKGSARFGRNRKTGGKHLIPQSARLVAWEAAVRKAAQKAARFKFRPGEPIGINMVFRLPAQKSESQVSLARGGYCPRPPDIDKLARATADPLEGIVLATDAQICSLHASKVIAPNRAAAGAYIELWSLA